VYAWRHNNNLICLESKRVHGGQQFCECTENSAHQHQAIFSHLQNVDKATDHYGFHKGVHVYMRLCTKNLPPVAQYRLINDDCHPQIVHIHKPIPGKFRCKAYSDLEDTWSESDVAFKTNQLIRVVINLQYHLHTLRLVLV